MSEIMMANLMEGSNLFLVIISITAPLSIFIALSTKAINVFISFLYGRVRI